LQTFKYRAHIGRPIDCAGQGPDASRVAARNSVAKRTRPTRRYDASSAHGKTNGFPGTAKVIRVIGKFLLYL